MAKLSSLLNVLSSWIGKNESNNGDDYIIDIYNSQRVSGAYKMSHTDPWCHATVSAASYVAGCTSIIPNTAYCPDGINWFKNKGRWVGRYDNKYNPSKGAIIYYDWGGDGESDHVGVCISRDGTEITVREGNKNDALEDRTISIYNTLIQGYGSPLYDDVDTSNTVINVTETTRNWLQIGDTGDRVKDLQTKLISLSYDLSPYGADGDFGSKTLSAVKQFQSDNGLEVDGEAGELTLAKLNAIWKTNNSSNSTSSSTTIAINTNTKTVDELRRSNLASYSMITVDEMNAWINKCNSSSPFNGHGDVFINVSNKVKLDPRYILAHAALESAWGVSKICQDKNNYFGIAAFDSSPYESAYSFGTGLEAGIGGGAAWIRKNYYDAGQTSVYTMRWNNGNHEYATDPEWDTIIAQIMKSAPVNTLYTNSTSIIKDTSSITVDNNTTNTNTSSNWLSRLQKAVNYTGNEDEATPELLNKFPTLTRKSKGELVTLLQEKLQELDYSVGNAGIDGDYGDDTKTAVENYQKDNNLHITGFVTVDVWAKLLNL